jgi:hypothetical protein
MEQNAVSSIAPPRAHGHPDGTGMAEAASQRPDYERSDVSARLVGGLAAGLIAFLLLTPVALHGIYTIPHDEAADPLPAVPAPRLQIDATAELSALRRAEDTLLAGYGWVNQPTGIVRLPIERAISLTAERGLPGWETP